MSDADTTQQTAFLRAVDAWLGITACAICTTWRALTEKAKPDETGRKGLLFIKLAEQGSTVLAAAAIQDAIREHGAENVYFLVFKENRFILDTMELIPPQNVLEIQTDNFLQILSTAFGQLRRIWKLKLLSCVDLEFFARTTGVFAFATGIPRRVGFHSYFGEGPWRGNLFTHRPRYNPHQHTSTIFRGLVAALNCDPKAFPRFEWIPPKENPPLPHFHATEQEKAAMQSLIATHTGGKHTALVLLNANASDLLPLRRWADENYVALAKRVLALSGNHYVAFTGGPSEAEKIAQLVNALGSPRAFCAAGKTTLRELLAFYELSDVLVTNDSGPAHFAALTDIDTVVLFGPETPQLFSALSPRSHPIVAGLACTPCVSAFNNRQTSCTNNVCMQQITVEQVLGAVQESLGRRGRFQ